MDFNQAMLPYPLPSNLWAVHWHANIIASATHQAAQKGLATFRLEVWLEHHMDYLDHLCLAIPEGKTSFGVWLTNVCYLIFADRATRMSDQQILEPVFPFDTEYSFTPEIAQQVHTAAVAAAALQKSVMPRTCREVATIIADAADELSRTYPASRRLRRLYPPAPDTIDATYTSERWRHNIHHLAAVYAQPAPQPRRHRPR